LYCREISWKSGSGVVSYFNVIVVIEIALTEGIDSDSADNGATNNDIKDAARTQTFYFHREFSQRPAPLKSALAADVSSGRRSRHNCPQANLSDLSYCCRAKVVNTIVLY
jgi:hypothetical protein